MRIFPEQFEIVPLGGSAGDPRPAPGNQVATVHAGLVDGGGEWGARLLEFLGRETVGEIYARHGLARPG
jgi:hypothetical protein